MIQLGKQAWGRGVHHDNEWLITNGIGGYASGTVTGLLTRRYHGLLVAALNPPLGRTVLVSKIDETASYAGSQIDLYSNQWLSDADTPTPSGFDHLNRFYLAGTTPVWEYAIGDALVEKRVWMTYGENTTYVQYRLLRASQPLTLTCKVLTNYKDFHSNTHANGWQMQIESIPNGLRVHAYDGATPFTIVSPEGDIARKHDWYRGYFLALEAYRGLDAHGDHLHAATVTRQLNEGDTLTVILTTHNSPEQDANRAYQHHLQRERQLAAHPPLANAPDWIRHLLLSADQFIVKREAANRPDGRSIIAGYHWFGDWGRDTMISLPGLTLTTGRTAEAAAILRTFGQYVDQGMLPNRFPDNNETPEYNTVDATLWYIEALRQYHAITSDDTLIQELFPVLADIIEWHIKGTRYNIHVDDMDGLLYSGEDGVQLTWMDAKVGDWVVTPRTGKAVEVNALWYNALRIMADFATVANVPGENYTERADQVRASFSRFWNTDTGCCYDVIDTPHGHDPALRPNQLFAVSLHHSPLTSEQAQAVVDHYAQQLYTPHGLRSLTPNDPAYVGVYGGDSLQRDGSYHQGTVWGWLIGAFVEAHLRVYDDRAKARSFLAPFEHHLHQQCVGSIAEIFDGDAPFTPRGAMAQAWSVAEILRAWTLTNQVSD